MAKKTGGASFTTSMRPAHARVLTSEAVEFVASLHRTFDAERRRLLALRAERRKAFDGGALPDFLAATAAVRAGDWKIAPLPPDLRDRRVEITGPTDRKMIINGLNSGARVFMADFEDSNVPTWDNLMVGQSNLMDRWTGDMEFIDPVSKKRYAMAGKPAVLMVRPRGLHLDEARMKVDGAPVAGAFFDFGLYAFHNARTAVTKMSGPYFYLPKLESHLEARLWNQVFIHAQSALGLPLGTIKATVLIETLPAAFEMDEIIFELRDHMAGLNCGRWDYIFSFIKTFANNPKFVLPDRGQLTMAKGFLAAYSALLVRTCHRRGCFAMGGMAAQIPNRTDAEAHAAALDKVRADKEREARNGHDGTWVAHPDLVPVAMKVFNEYMPTPNQFYVSRDDVEVGQKDLLALPEGTRSEEGFRENLRVGVRYLEAWLRGRGAVPLYNLMEDTATAEIARAQIWQWLRFGVKLANGRKVTRALFDACLKEEMAKVRSEIGREAFAGGRFKDAIALFKAICTARAFEPFLTIPASKKLS